MKHRQFAALAGGAAARVLAIDRSGARAPAPAVTVRVEGVKRTLLPATVAHAESGSITKGGTPKGTCPGSAAAGAFDVATHRNWGGTYSSGLGVEITTSSVRRTRSAPRASTGGSASTTSSPPPGCAT